MAGKRKQPAERSAPPAKAPAVECEFCGKSFKPRGLKRHQSHCANKKRTLTHKTCFERVDFNVLTNILSFLSNQSKVKLQSVTGAHYAGSDPLVSSICCSSCENDELAVGNGLCCACNKEEDPNFRETITTTDARKLYGIQDIYGVRHDTYTVRHRGFYCLFKYDDLNRFAISRFGSKENWLKMLSKKVARRRKLNDTKSRKEEEHQAFLSTFPEDFVEYLTTKTTKRGSENLIKEQAERYKLMVDALAERELPQQIHGRSAVTYIMNGFGQVNEIADSIVREDREKKDAKQREEEVRQYMKTLPKQFVNYLGYYSAGKSKDAVKQQYERYKLIVAALEERDVQLRSDSVLCRQFITQGQGEIDDIADTMEEMKFLFAYTSYASDCKAVRPERRHRYYDEYYDEYSDYSGDSDYSDDWVPEATLRQRREQVKNRIRDRYLQNSQGLTLPRKWQRMLPSTSPGSPTL